MQLSAQLLRWRGSELSEQIEIEIHFFMICVALCCLKEDNLTTLLFPLLFCPNPLPPIETNIKL